MGQVYIWALSSKQMPKSGDEDGAHAVYYQVEEASEPYDEEWATDESVGPGRSFDYQVIGGAFDGAIHRDPSGELNAPPIIVPHLKADHECKYSNMERASELVERLKADQSLAPQFLVTAFGQIVNVTQEEWDRRVEAFGGYRPASIEYGYERIVETLLDFPNNAVVGMGWHS